MGKGRTFELDKVREINSAVYTDHVFTSALDYSGNAADTDADIAISYIKDRETFALHLIELKKRQGDDGKRVSNVMGGSGTDETGKEELRRLVDAGPTFATSWLAIKFDHRELVMVPAGYIWERITDRPETLEEDWRHKRRTFSEDERRYIRRCRVPHYWNPSDEIKLLSPRLTPSESISMVKPSLDWWESSTSGDSDVDVILDTIDIPSDYRK